jgi:hypothetical protein
VLVESGPEARVHLKVAHLADQAPHDLARLAVYLVDGAGPAARDEQATVVVHVYGIDVKVVEGPSGFFGGS